MFGLVGVRVRRSMFTVFVRLFVYLLYSTWYQALDTRYQVPVTGYMNFGQKVPVSARMYVYTGPGSVNNVRCKPWYFMRAWTKPSTRVQ